MMIDLYETAHKRSLIQKENAEDIHYFKHTPFDKKFKIRKFPSGLAKIIELGDRNGDELIIPDYQRDLVWNIENKQNLIFAIMNGTPIGEFVFARETVDSKARYFHRWVVLDGQQRMNALKEFVQDGFKDKDGRFYSEYSYREMIYLFEDFDGFTAVYIQDLPEKDQIEIYLSKNIGGVAHTEIELRKAKELLEKIIHTKVI